MSDSDRYLLDTDWAVCWLRGRPQEVVGTLIRLPPNSLYVSLLSLAELYAGAFYYHEPQRLLTGVDGLLSRAQLVNLTDAVCRRYGEIYAHLRRGGDLIGKLDTLIAATCLEYDFVLLTNNRRHFERVPGLRIMSACRGHTRVLASSVRRRTPSALRKAVSQAYLTPTCGSRNGTPPAKPTGFPYLSGIAYGRA